MTVQGASTPAGRHADARQRENLVVACRAGSDTAVEMRAVLRPGAGEVLLALRAVGLCGTDMFKLQTASEADGTVLGHELVGEVVELGAGVGHFGIGDRVAVPHHVPCGECLLCRRGSETMCPQFRENLLEPGGFAEHILVRPRAAALAARRVPDGVEDEAAVFMEPAACVLRGIHRSGIGEGETAVVQGGGSMGLLHLLVLRAVFPAMAVVVVDPLPDRRAMAERLGAAAAAPPGAEAADHVRQASGGIGAGAVFDTVGGPGPLEAALALSREGGTVVLFAHAPEGARAGFDLNTLFKFERRVLGSYSGTLSEQAEVFALLERGALDPSPLVTHRLPLDRFAEGVDLVRRHAALKVVFTPTQGSKSL